MITMSEEESIIPAIEALERLIAGNERFIYGSTQWSGLLKAPRKILTHPQRPYATILGCSDSRVPPELIFDCGLGELFVIRVAGNVFSPEIAGSLQYAGCYLRTPLFVVLGHQDCGVVTAALESRYEDVQHCSRVQVLVDNMLHGFPSFDLTLESQVRTELAIESNIRWTMKQIVDATEGRSRLAENMRIVGAVFELATGRVRFLDSC